MHYVYVYCETFNILPSERIINESIDPSDVLFIGDYQIIPIFFITGGVNRLYYKSVV